jgi:hypothetical protein
MESWPLIVLIAAAALLFRGQGDTWQFVVAKLAALVVLALLLIAVLGSLLVWLR